MEGDNRKRCKKKNKGQEVSGRKYDQQNTVDGKKMTRDITFELFKDRWSLRSGKKGPTLLQDFHFYRKQSLSSQERPPEKLAKAASSLSSDNSGE